MKDGNTICTPILLALGFLALCPITSAVIPPSDGCYLNFTTAEGCDALNFLTTGAGNTGVGWRSLFSNTNGNFNTGVGAGTLLLNAGDSNTAVGAAALLLNTAGTQNVAVGTDALVSNDSGIENVAVGFAALFNNTTIAGTSGTDNTAVGTRALQNNTTGSQNVAVGTDVLLNNTGSGNIALGFQAGLFLNVGANNIEIGNKGAFGESGTIRIGVPSGQGAQTACYIAGIYNVDQGGTGVLPVYINSAGRLGTASSSRRFKHDIKAMEKASESILALKPVTFHYNSDKTATPQFGLIAEEVAEVNPDLVVRDEKGEIYTVRYDAVNAMLLNEFLKEHKKVEQQNRKIQEQEATISQLKKDFGATIARLITRLDEQASQIQKVSAQLEVSKAPPHMAGN